MKFLLAEKEQQQYHFIVLMDTSKLLKDGTPDPEYVRVYSWGLESPDGQTEEQYLDSIKREIGLLVSDELNIMNPITPESTHLTGF